MPAWLSWDRRLMERVCWPGSPSAPGERRGQTEFRVFSPRERRGQSDPVPPRIPKDGAIPDDADSMPDEIGYDESRNRLLVGRGFLDNVPPAVWRYEVSGKRVLTQWFSYRKKDRERPIIGDRRPPSKLGDIQPDHWLAEYTTELLNVLHVLALLVEMEPAQAKLLEAICGGPTLDYRR